MPTVKRNFFYSSILTISGYLFPLITYPYVTRVLGVDKLGTCNFVDSIIQYGILFSMLGIGTVAIREIAQSKGNKEKLSETFSSILVLNMVTSIVATSVIILLAYTVPSFYEYKKLIIIGSARILFNSLLVEWLYKGLEEFRYITIRSIIIRILYVVAVFVFVRTSEDYIKYFIITVLIVVANAIINIAYSHNYLQFTLRGLKISGFLKPVLILGLYNILTSMYTSFNVMYLGLVSGTTEVGYYTTAIKLHTIVMSIFTAFTGVMMPRQSALLGAGNENEFLRLSGKSIDFLLAFVMPLIVCIFCFADNVVLLIAGAGYDGAVIPLRIITPLLFVIGYEQIIVTQMLMPLKKDNAILINSIIGALVGISLNLILVKYYGGRGSSIVWVASETAVMISGQLYLNKYISFNFPWKKLFGRVLVAMPIMAICILIKKIGNDDLLTLLIGTCIIGIYYLMIEIFYYKNNYILAGIKRINNNRR